MLTSAVRLSTNVGMDPELVAASRHLATAVGGALAAKPLLERLLGPSFEYVGQAMCQLFERYGNRTLADIFRRAAEKAETQATHVDARVLRSIIEDGSFAQDAVTREYFAGILASSLMPEADDHAITFLNIIKGLTKTQLRLHHLVYSGFRTNATEYQTSFYAASGGPQLFVSDDVLVLSEITSSVATKTHAITGLAREDLLGHVYQLQTYAVRTITESGHNGVKVQGSPLGAQLFLWVHGHPNSTADDLLRDEIQLVDWFPDDRKWFISDRELAEQSRVLAQIKVVLDHALDLRGSGGYDLREELRELRGFAPYIPAEALRSILSVSRRHVTFETRQRAVFALRRAGEYLSGRTFD